MMIPSKFDEAVRNFSDDLKIAHGDESVRVWLNARGYRYGMNARELCDWLRVLHPATAEELASMLGAHRGFELWALRMTLQVTRSMTTRQIEDFLKPITQEQWKTLGELLNEFTKERRVPVRPLRAIVADLKAGKTFPRMPIVVTSESDLDFERIDGEHDLANGSHVWCAREETIWCWDAFHSKFEKIHLDEEHEEHDER